MENTAKLIELLKTQDMNENYTKEMVELGEENELGEYKDPLTAYVIKSFIERDDMEDFERDLDYAIDSLKRIKNAI